MQYRPFGKHGFKCSEIGFGAWAIGGSWGAQADNHSLAALNRALDLGCNFINTAAGYTMPQAALKWVLAHPAVSVVIPGIRNVTQAEANCGVSDLPAMPGALLTKLRRHNWRRGVWYGGK